MEPTMITRTEVLVRTPAGADQLGVCLNRAAAGGPFRVVGIEAAGAGFHRCVFDPKDPDMQIGYRSVIELQYRIDDTFDILSVSCEDTYSHLAKATN
jgi:hypothetical protein